MKQPISFIIPCYNCADTLEESLLSILETNLEAGDEIILIDDASTDGTLQLLRRWGEKYPFIKVLRHNINKGTAAAGRNTGIDASVNELVFCLDADNILYPNSIKPLKDFLLTNALDVAAFGRIDYFQEDPKKPSGHWDMMEKLNFIPALNDPMKTPCGSGNFLYTKAIWKKAGRYNESLGGAYDSEIFGLKLLAEGAKFWTLPGTAYLHRQGYESTFIREWGKRNPSLLFLAALIDYWNQVEEDDVDWIFGKGRLSWMDKIAERPLRPRTQKKKNELRIFLWKVKQKVLKVLGRV